MKTTLTTKHLRLRAVKKRAKARAKLAVERAKAFVLNLRGINPEMTNTRGCLPDDAFRKGGEYA